MTQPAGQLKSGTYAVTTVYKMPWTKKESTPVKPKRIKVDKKIVHEIFERCSELTEDQYWVSIFKNCARDKFPRGFQYKHGILIHRRGNKTARLVIPVSFTEAHDECIKFFKSTAGMMSIADRRRVQKEDEERLLEETSKKEIQWKDIRVERIKEVLINEYISDLAEKSNFNEQQKKELSTTIKKGFMLKYFTSKQIEMEHGKIKSIKGLLCNNNDNNNESKYYIDPKICKNIARKNTGLGMEGHVNKVKISPMTLWEKYLENQEKKINNKNGIKIIDNSLSESYSEYPSPDITGSPTGDSL
jgi:hypothetical protein